MEAEDAEKTVQGEVVEPDVEPPEQDDEHEAVQRDDGDDSPGQGDPAEQEDDADKGGEKSRQCICCQTTKDKGDFGKNQWYAKGSDARCVDCNAQTGRRAVQRAGLVRNFRKGEVVACPDCNKWMQAPESASALNCANSDCRRRIWPPPGTSKRKSPGDDDDDDDDDGDGDDDDDDDDDGGDTDGFAKDEVVECPKCNKWMKAAEPAAGLNCANPICRSRIWPVDVKRKAKSGRPSKKVKSEPGVAALEQALKKRDTTIAKRDATIAEMTAAHKVTKKELNQWRAWKVPASAKAKLGPGASAGGLSGASGAGTSLGTQTLRQALSSSDRKKWTDAITLLVQIRLANGIDPKELTREVNS
jgi:hypothetical protein